EYTLDTVMDSNPAAGETLEKGDTIQLTVSQGPKIGKVTVPSFVGQPLEKVKGDLEKWKLTLGPVKLIPSDQSGGVIVSQTIPDTTEVDENTTIGFEVSSGLAPTVRNINCELPDDRDTVQLSISVGNEVQFDEKVDCSKTVIRVPLTGSGTQTVVIFWDGMEQVRYELQFD
ncbi:MAG: PASTA domain-containing protein, partial [Oscillibacter sp.]